MGVTSLAELVAGLVARGFHKQEEIDSGRNAEAGA
jgi:hypothetical protein